MLALAAALVLAPLLYIPGSLLLGALAGPAQPPDPLERHFERALAGALLNGWLALTLAGFGLFAAWLHLALIAAISTLAGTVAWRRGGLRLPSRPPGIVATARPAARPAAAAWLRAHWDALAFLVIGLLFAALVARPFEVILGARDAGVYANTGFAIARTGAIVQHNPLIASIAADQASSDPELRAAAEQAETNFLGVQKRERNIATRLHVAGFMINEGDLPAGRIVPQFFHLYPAWIALLAGLLGLQGGLLATGLLGLLGVWSVGMLGRRLAGPLVGVLAALLLALNGVQVWFSRYSTSEASVQFLCFAALYAFANMQRSAFKVQSDLPSADRPLSIVHRPPSWLYGLLCGLAAGQWALTRIDFFLIVGPLALYLLYIWVTRRWGGAHAALLAGLGAMLAQAALHVTFIARAYFFDTAYARLQDFALTALVSLPFITPTMRVYFLSRADSAIGIRLGPAQYLWNWQRIALEIALVVLLLLTLWTLRRRGQGLLAAGERAVRRAAPWLLRLSAAGIVLLGLYAYLVRPQILTAERLVALPGCLAPAQARAPEGPCLALQGYIGAPIAPPLYPNAVAYRLQALAARLRGQPAPPTPAACAAARPGDDALARACRRLQLRDLIANAQANLVRIGWYLSPPGVLLGLAGCARWWRRGLRADSWLFLAVALASAVFFIRITYGTSDQTYIYILRRYMPVVYPAFCLAIAYALAALAGALGPRPGAPRVPRARQGLAVALAVALIAFEAVTNRRLYAHVEYRGALAQVEALAARFGPRDVVLWRGGDHVYAAARDLPDLLVTPFSYAFGRDALVIKSKEPGRYAADLARYIRRWQEQGRQVYLALGASGAVGLPGIGLEPVGRFQFQAPEFEALTDQKPANVRTLEMDYMLYRAAPAAPLPTALTPHDYAAQVGGFYRAERIAGREVTWTDGDAALRLPWPADGRMRLRLALSGGATRPSSLGPATVCLSYRPEGDFWAENPAAAFSAPRCYALGPDMREIVYEIDGRGQPAPPTGALLLRLTSEPWVPAAADPAQHDRRALGVQFGGLSVE